MNFPKFNYDTQEWMEGRKVIPEKDNWDYPCAQCNSPAKIEGMTATHELYRCLSCNYITKVN